MTDDKKREILAQVGRVSSEICYGCPIIERYLELMSAQPEIVRCKDCKHLDPEDHHCDSGHDIVWQLSRRDDWYCADGERSS